MSREDFNQTWLFEMPEGLGNFDTYDMLDSPKRISKWG
jgi:hypothetical protein